MPSQNPENAQKLHFCTIQKSQFDPQSPKTTSKNAKKTKSVQVQRQGPRHAHSEGKTGPRLLTHRFVQNHSGPILGKQAATLLEQSRGMPPQNPENAQKFHLCKIQKSQFDFHSLITTTNDSKHLKPIKNTNLTT